MRRTVVAFLAALTVATAVSGLAEAQGIGRLDRDGDGFISRDEADAFSGGRFEVMDEDGDGAVTRGEMMERLRRRMEHEFGERFDQLDVNRDGRIDRNEYRRRGGGRFDRLDLDGDGRISAEEMRRARGRGRK